MKTGWQKTALFLPLNRQIAIGSNKV